MSGVGVLWDELKAERSFSSFHIQIQYSPAMTPEIRHLQCQIALFTLADDKTSISNPSASFAVAARKLYVCYIATSYPMSV